MSIRSKTNMHVSSYMYLVTYGQYTIFPVLNTIRLDNKNLHNLKLFT